MVAEEPTDRAGPLVEDYVSVHPGLGHRHLDLRDELGEDVGSDKGQRVEERESCEWDDRDWLSVVIQYLHEYQLDLRFRGFVMNLNICQQRPPHQHLIMGHTTRMPRAHIGRFHRQMLSE